MPGVVIGLTCRLSIDQDGEASPKGRCPDHVTGRKARGDAARALRICSPEVVDLAWNGMAR